MKCQRVLSLLSAYLDGEISEKIKGQVEEHLVSCKECTQRLSELKEAVRLVGELGKVTIPAEESSQIRAATKRSIERRGKPSPNLWQQLALKPAYSRYLIAAASILVLLIIILIPLRIRQTSVPERTPEKAPISPSGTTQRTGKELFTRGSFSTQKLSPEVKVSNQNYKAEEVDRFASQPIAQRFAETYTVADSKKFVGELIASMLNQAEGMGIPTEGMRRSLEVVLGQSRYPSLPSYAEKTKLEGQEVWIIVVNWGTGGDEAKLNRIKIYAISPTDQKIFYSFSK